MSGQSRTIGRFDDATLIGRGGFGAVYEADDAEHGRKVAIKVLPGTMGDTERRRFDRERQTMGRLGSHPNIIPVHESGYTDDGEGYIVMELAPGGSLRARLDEEGPLGWEEAIGIAIAMAGAAQAAHDQGVLHRDIKPDNILIDGYGNPRLTDFGIAAVASNATATTSTTATLAHAAPELLEGQTSTVAVDIYAIGSTFYNLVMGHPPFMTDETVGVTAMIGRALTQPPPDLRPLGVPDAVAAVIERSMAKEAGDRQRSAAELADALRAAQSNPGATMVAPPSADPPGAQATAVADRPLAHPEAYIDPSGQAAATGGAQVPHAPPPHLQVPVESTPSGAPTTAVPTTAPLASVGPGGGVGAPPGMAPAPSTPPPEPAGGGRGRLPLLLALAALGVAVVAAGAVLALAGGDDTATTSTTSSTTEPDATSTTPPPTTTTTAPTTSPSTTASSTTASPTTATTAAPAPTTAPGSCPVRIVDGRTARFNVMICGDGSGGARYQANNRETGDGIQLPACFAGFGLFVATNEGFSYEVDTESGFLFVIDPDGDVVVTEEFLTPLFLDFSPVFPRC